MKIFIPTLGRGDNQPTWSVIPSKWRLRTSLIVSPDEALLHTMRGRNTIICPINGQHGKTIGDVRQWMIETFPEEPILMLDDDLRFCTWNDGGPKLRPTTEDDMNDLFQLCEEAFQQYSHIGIHPRAGVNNVHPANEKIVGRACTAWGVTPSVLLKNNIRFDAIHLMEDFHVILSLLQKGYPNKIICSHQWDQKGCNTSGGCSTYRTPETQKQAAEMLHQLHPDFVTVVEKETKGRWGAGMDVRYDVRVQWKKAYERGIQCTR